MPEKSEEEPIPGSLQRLVSHAIAVAGNTPLATVQRAFREHAFKYMAIEENGRATGLCSRERIGNLLGSQYGYSIYAKKPVRDYAVPGIEPIVAHTQLDALLTKVFARPDDQFHHDVLIVNAQHELIGLISIEQLVRLQNRLLNLKISELGASQRDLLKQTDRLTELTKQLELTNEQLQIARDAAIEATELKSQFLANMSHEIRTPMNGVVGMVSLLMDAELSEEQRHYCDTIRSSTDALLTLINDILDFSKIEAGHLDILPEDTPIASLLEECVHLLSESIGTKPVELILDVAPEVPAWVHLDPVRYREIINNLLGNAIKFTDEGTILVRLSLAGSAHEGYFLQTEVEDTGIGISTERLNDLFEPFVQGEGSANRKYGGTGLGLAISRRLAVLLEGTLECRSQLGQGSVFSCRLPLVAANQPVPRDPLPRLPGGLRALIVDDQPLLCQVLSRQLATLGLQAETCATAKEAIARIQQAREEGDDLHLCLADADLPAKGAEQLAAALEAQEGHPAITSIMMQPIGRRQQTRSERIPCQGWLLKPISPHALAQILLRLAPKPDEHPGAEIDTPDNALGLRILIAESNPHHMQNLRQQVAALGCNAIIAVDDGMAVLEVLRSQPVDLAIIAGELPTLDGCATTRAIREGFHGVEDVDLAIIGALSPAEAPQQSRYRESGMNGILVKPIMAKNLAKMLHDVVQKQIRLKNFSS